MDHLIRDRDKARRRPALSDLLRRIGLRSENVRRRITPARSFSEQYRSKALPDLSSVLVCYRGAIQTARMKAQAETLTS